VNKFGFEKAFLLWIDFLPKVAHSNKKPPKMVNSFSWDLKTNEEIP
jgi:hypothetical protein